MLFALLSSLVLGVAPCAGAPLEVPSRLLGWADADAAWLEQELAGWMKQRERELCAPTRTGPEEYTVRQWGLASRSRGISRPPRAPT